MTTTWHILGPGAIGSLFACYLQQSGLRVYLIDRNGISAPRTIDLVEGDHRVAHHFEGDDNHQPIHQLLVTVKAHQTATALKSVSARLASGAIVLLLQNGMGTWLEAEPHIRDSVMLLGTTTEGANRPIPNQVNHAGRGETHIGALEPSQQPIAEAVCQQWSGLSLQLAADADIRSRLWRKLAINCAINPLTAIYDCPNGELLQKPAALSQMQAICNEVETVMSLALERKSDGLYALAKSVAERTGENISSMLQDVRKRQPTEIDFITGYLLREAERLGTHCPHNEALYKQVKQMY